MSPGHRQDGIGPRGGAAGVVLLVSSGLHTGMVTVEVPSHLPASSLGSAPGLFTCLRDPF